MEQCDVADLRWHANLHFKASLPHELLDNVDAALEHVAAAAKQLRFLVKQARAASCACRVD